METTAGGHRRFSIAGPGLLLGAGLGGFVDGFLLHQILQWHHLLSETESDLTVNTLWDGLFHAASWVLVVVGALWLSRRLSGTGVRFPMRALVGTLLAGWGLFNLVEGLVDHHLLRIHHVRPGPDELVYDLSFLALGAVLVAAGTLMYRNATRSRTDL